MCPEVEYLTVSEYHASHFTYTFSVLHGSLLFAASVWLASAAQDLLCQDLGSSWPQIAVSCTSVST